MVASFVLMQPKPSIDNSKQGCLTATAGVGVTASSQAAGRVSINRSSSIWCRPEVSQTTSRPAQRASGSADRAGELGELQGSSCTAAVPRRTRPAPASTGCRFRSRWTSMTVGRIRSRSDSIAGVCAGDRRTHGGGVAWERKRIHIPSYARPRVSELGALPQARRKSRSHTSCAGTCSVSSAEGEPALPTAPPGRLRSPGGAAHRGPSDPPRCPGCRTVGPQRRYPGARDRVVVPRCGDAPGPPGPGPAGRGAG